MNKEIVFVFMFSVFWSALGIVSENMFASKKLLNKRGSMDSFCDQCIQSGIELEEDYKSLAILCTPKPGDYVVDMQDSYGDGWQTDEGNGGSGLKAILTLADGSESIVEVAMCSPYGGSNIGTFTDPTLGGCTGPASTSFYAATAYVEIPEGTQSADWYFPGDRYGEISFQIYGPDNNLIFNGEQGATGAGQINVSNCL